MRSTIVLLALLGAGACAGSYHLTPVPACAKQPDGTRPSRGALEVLRSDVPGIELDSMRWRVSTASLPFGGIQAELYMAGRITSTSESSLSGIGVLFEGERDSQTVFRQLVTDFVVVRPIPMFEQNASTLIDLHRVRPDRPAPVWLSESAFADQVPASWGCPARARLVREMELAKHTGLLARVARDTAGRLAERRASAGTLEPIEILADTLLARNLGGHVLAGVAVNTTDRTLRNAAVWFAVRRPPTGVDMDTLSFLLGDVPPHALVSFGGGKVDVTDVRSAHGAWVDEQEGPRVTALHNHSVSEYRRADNGRTVPSLTARDELPASEFYPWNPATFDLDSVLATRRHVLGLIHGAAVASERAEVIVIQSKVLYRSRAEGVIRADSSRTLQRELDSLFAGQRVMERVRNIPPPIAEMPLTSEDSARRVLEPRAGEDVVLYQTAGGWIRRLRFPAGQPPAEAKQLFDALRRIERRSAARASAQ